MLYVTFGLLKSQKRVYTVIRDLLVYYGQINIGYDD